MKHNKNFLNQRTQAENDAAVETNTAVEIEPENDIVIGIVTKCSRLNIRAQPSTDAEILCVVNAGSELTINKSQSNSEWYSVRAESGIEGFCMNAFVQECGEN